VATGNEIKNLRKKIISNIKQSEMLEQSLIKQKSEINKEFGI